MAGQAGLPVNGQQVARFGEIKVTQRIVGETHQ
jgi:septal ring factor EnvC (AmiA/AmiB activator)